MKSILTISTLAALAALPLAAADKKNKGKTWTDPEVAVKEDPDFSTQGEYFASGVKADLGAQVVALGDGKFDAYVLEGGVPGAGWTPDKKKIKLTGQREGDTVKFGEVEGYSAAIADGAITVTTGGKSVTLPRNVRHSPTVGAKPPKGAVVLFDGTDAKHWKKGKVENGLLAATGTTSIPVFNDCHIHLEFRTPYKPHARGQGRGNSGVYYMGRWETQVLDSFGLTGEMNECGGIYSIAKPKLNMCLPPLTWQTYDVDYTAATFGKDGVRTAWPKMTVKLNGVLVHDQQEMNKTHTTAAPVKGEITTEGGPIYLQAHGNPVFYRNIWVVEK